VTTTTKVLGAVYKSQQWVSWISHLLVDPQPDDQQFKVVTPTIATGDGGVLRFMSPDQGPGIEKTFTGHRVSDVLARGLSNSADNRSRPS